jgi:hypothetical protein
MRRAGHMGLPPNGIEARQRQPGCHRTRTDHDHRRGSPRHRRTQIDPASLSSQGRQPCRPHNTRDCDGRPARLRTGGGSLRTRPRHHSAERARLQGRQHHHWWQSRRRRPAGANGGPIPGRSRGTSGVPPTHFRRRRFRGTGLTNHGSACRFQAEPIGLGQAEVAT